MDTGTLLVTSGTVLAVLGILVFFFLKIAWLQVCGAVFGIIGGVVIMFLGGSMNKESERIAKMAQYAHVWVVTEDATGNIRYWEANKLPDRPEDVALHGGFNVLDGGLIFFERTDQRGVFNVDTLQDSHFRLQFPTYNSPFCQETVWQVRGGAKAWSKVRRAPMEKCTPKKADNGN